MRGGCKIGRIRLRRVAKADFQNFDLNLAMDSENLQQLKRICRSELRYKLRLLLQLAHELAVADTGPTSATTMNLIGCFFFIETGYEGWILHLSP